MILITRYYFILLVLAVFFSSSCLSQNSESKNRIEPSILFGGNYSKLHYEGENQAALVRPFVGFGSHLKISPQFELGATVTYFSKASRVAPTITMHQTGFGFYLAPTLRLNDFRFMVGFAFENALSNNIKSTSNTRIDNASLEETETLLTTNFLAIDFRLNEQFDLFVNNTFYLPEPFPSPDKKSYNIMVGLKYRLTQQKTPPSVSVRQQRRESSIKHIKALKDGVLLVRLKTAQTSIEALEKKGDVGRAEKLKLRQEYINRNLIRAFKKHYNFSEVQFFYSHSSLEVKKGNLSNIFLDKNLQVDSSIQVSSNKSIYTAELSTIEQDSLQQFSYNETGLGGDLPNTERYYGSPNLGLKGLVIKTQDFKQLTRPFPFYTRYVAESLNSHPEMLLMGPHFLFYLYTPNLDLCVEKLNFKLNRYYQRK